MRQVDQERHQQLFAAERERNHHQFAIEQEKHLAENEQLKQKHLAVKEVINKTKEHITYVKKQLKKGKKTIEMVLS